MEAEIETGNRGMVGEQLFGNSDERSTVAKTIGEIDTASIAGKEVFRDSGERRTQKKAIAEISGISIVREDTFRYGF